MKITSGELWLTIGGILGVGALIIIVLAFTGTFDGLMTDHLNKLFTDAGNMSVPTPSGGGN